MAIIECQIEPVFVTIFVNQSQNYKLQIKKLFLYQFYNLNIYCLYLTKKKSIIINQYT